MLSRIAIIVLMLGLLFGSLSVFAAGPALDYEKAQDFARIYAKQLWGEVQVGAGVTFVDPENKPAVYMFLIYCGTGNIPTDEAIRTQVAAARASRLAGEAMLAEAARTKNHALQEKANESIEAAWLQMRDEEHFGTVFLNANNPKNPGIAVAVCDRCRRG